MGSPSKHVLVHEHTSVKAHRLLEISYFLLRRAWFISLVRTLSVVPRPMSVVFGLGTRLRVRMRTKLENGIVHNEQQPQCVVNGFY